MRIIKLPNGGELAPITLSVHCSPRATEWHIHHIEMHLANGHLIYDDLQLADFPRADQMAIEAGLAEVEHKQRQRNLDLVRELRAVVA